MSDNNIPDDQVADNKTLQYEIRKLRERVADLEKVVSPHSIKLCAGDTGHYIEMKVSEYGSGIWAGKGPGWNTQHPSVAIYTGFGQDTAVVGVWSKHDQNRPTKGLDACLWADANGSGLQMTDADNFVHEFSAEGLEPGAAVKPV